MGTSSAANPILLRVGEAEYTIAFGSGAVRRMEARTGKAFGQLSQEMGNLSFTACFELLKAAIETHHPDLTDDDIDGIIDTVGFSQLDKPLGDAFTRDLKSDEANPRKPRRRRGTTS